MFIPELEEEIKIREDIRLSFEENVDSFVFIDQCLQKVNEKGGTLSETEKQLVFSTLKSLVYKEEQRIRNHRNYCDNVLARIDATQRSLALTGE